MTFIAQWINACSSFEVCVVSELQFSTASVIMIDVAFLNPGPERLVVLLFICQFILSDHIPKESKVFRKLVRKQHLQQPESTVSFFMISDVVVLADVAGQFMLFSIAVMLVLLDKCCFCLLQERCPPLQSASSHVF